MTTPIANQLAARMKAKNFTNATLEKEAGLQRHAVQNILRGKSKRPNVESVQAIADVLGCTVKDLLKKNEMFQDQEPESIVLSTPYNHPELLLETVQWVNTMIMKNKTKLSTKQAVTCVEEIYFYSLQKNPTKVDEDYAHWFMDLVMH